MRKFLMLSTAVLTLVSAGAMAADPVPNNPAPPAAASAEKGMYHEWTLDEARKKAHEKADMLDKMTPEQYTDYKKEEHEKYAKKMHERYEKWNAMTPEQKEAAKKERHEKWLKKQEGSNATPESDAPKVPASGGQ